MEYSQLILVPQLSSVPGHQALAGRILRWLAQRQVVEALPSTCGLRGNRMAYAIGPGARQVVEHPDRLSFGQPVSGHQAIPAVVAGAAQHHHLGLGWVLDPGQHLLGDRAAGRVHHGRVRHPGLVGGGLNRLHLTHTDNLSSGHSVS